MGQLSPLPALRGVGDVEQSAYAADFLIRPPAGPCCAIGTKGSHPVMPSSTTHQSDLESDALRTAAPTVELPVFA
jgi:hypothetical protein